MTPDCFSINMGSSTLSNDSNIDALHLQKHRASKMSTVAFYALIPYGCSGLGKSFSSCTLRSNANTSHFLVCFIFSPRYARLAADVSQRVASEWPASGQPASTHRKLFVGGRSDSTQQIAVPYIQSPLPVRHGGKGKGPECSLCNLFHRKKKWYNILIFHPEIAKWSWHGAGEPCMTAPEKCDKTKAAGDITQPCSFCWQDCSPLPIFSLIINDRSAKTSAYKWSCY